MICAWERLLGTVPAWMRQDVDRFGKDKLQELRLRLNQPPQLCFGGTNHSLSGKVSSADIAYCVNTASRYSPWAAATASKGFVTAPGGHRIGLCGDVVTEKGNVTGIRTVTALCIRIARDFPGLSEGVNLRRGSVLIIGPPGSGKTTLLRDLIRRCSCLGHGSIGVVDERGELFPGDVFDTGPCTDVLTGCSKVQGIPMLLRTMGPAWIAVDEITEAEDLHAMVHASRCGVHLMATLHAASLDDLRANALYRQLLQAGIFRNILILRPDKTFREERMGTCT